MKKNIKFQKTWLIVIYALLIVKKIEKSNFFSPIHLNYNKGNCNFICTNYSGFCQTGALKKMILKKKK